MSSLSSFNWVAKPFKERNIYRTTTVCHKHVNGHWTFTGKIFYREGQTKGIQECHAETMETLLAEMHRCMTELNKR